jgi:hypothetical protein
VIGVLLAVLLLAVLMWFACANKSKNLIAQPTSTAKDVEL